MSMKDVAQLQLLQASEAALLAGVTPSGIHWAVRHGRLRVAAVTGRRLLLFRREDVLDYCRKRRGRHAV